MSAYDGGQEPIDRNSPEFQDALRDELGKRGYEAPVSEEVIAAEINAASTPGEVTDVLRRHGRLQEEY